MLFNDALPIHVFHKGLQYCTIGDMTCLINFQFCWNFCTGVFSENCKDVRHSHVILKMYNSATFSKEEAK
jgi:hypothetical protein